jgi:endonuclease G, mitochondrial
MYTQEQCRHLSLQAAERYSERVPEQRKVQAPRPSKSEVYLANTLAKDRTRALIAEAGATSGPASQAETLRSMSLERVIGTPDFRDVNYLEFAIAVSRSIARVHLRDGFGTGSLVGPRLLLTNHHVIDTFDVARTAIAEFDYQDDVNGNRLQVQSFLCDPTLFFHTDADLDFTVVGLAELSQIGTPINSYPWSRLIGTTGKTASGMPINIIQHPKGGLKQIVFRNNQVIDIPDGKADFLYYTTDTEPGSSGSPCFTDGWDMVALHHSGVPKVENGRIVGWIANEGVRVSAMVAALRQNVQDPRMQALLSEMLESQPPNPIEVARRSASHGDVRPVKSASGLTASWTIPLTLQISVGTPTADGQAPQVVVSQAMSNTAVAPAEVLEGLKVDPFTIRRKGYDEDFLGWDQPIPLPKLSAEQEADSVEVPAEHRGSHGRFVLDYYYYSLAMSKSRRFAWYSAANIDGDHRPQVPKRSSDKWHIDTRIEPDPSKPIHQIGEDLYVADKTDRGHLTRYLDLGWGDTPEAALAAMADTFHCTNCTLQLSAFNQGKDRWQGLEQFLLEQHARKEARKISVFTGPILRPQDPFYRNPRMGSAVRLPVGFWKVCAIVRQDGSLSATAFVMDQNDVVELPGFEERFDVVAVQVTIRDLERETGLDFGLLHDHDHFASGGAAGTLEVAREGGSVKRKAILDLGEIVA